MSTNGKQEKRCPDCGMPETVHRQLQDIANKLRADLGLPPLDPPDIDTGHQRR